jgi:predicted transcriptional regulator
MEKRIELEPTEVAQLKSHIQSTAELEAFIAKLSIRKLSIQGELESYFEKWKYQSEQLEELRKKMAEKYGDGTINLDEGYIDLK